MSLPRTLSRSRLLVAAVATTLAASALVGCSNRGATTPGQPSSAGTAPGMATFHGGDSGGSTTAAIGGAAAGASGIWDTTGWCPTAAAVSKAVGVPMESTDRSERSSILIWVCRYFGQPTPSSVEATYAFAVSARFETATLKSTADDQDAPAQYPQLGPNAYMTQGADKYSSDLGTMPERSWYCSLRVPMSAPADAGAAAVLPQGTTIQNGKVSGFVTLTLVGPDQQSVDNCDRALRLPAVFGHQEQGTAPTTAPFTPSAEACADIDHLQDSEQHKCLWAGFTPDVSTFVPDQATCRALYSKPGLSPTEVAEMGVCDQTNFDSLPTGPAGFAPSVDTCADATFSNLSVPEQYACVNAGYGGVD